MNALTKLVKEGGLRKVGIAVTVIASSTFLLYSGALESADYMKLTIGLCAAFFGANTFEHKAEDKKKKK